MILASTDGSVLELHAALMLILATVPIMPALAGSSVPAPAEVPPILGALDSISDCVLVSHNFEIHFLLPDLRFQRFYLTVPVSYTHLTLPTILLV